MSKEIYALDKLFNTCHKCGNVYYKMLYFSYKIKENNMNRGTDENRNSIRGTTNCPYCLKESLGQFLDDCVKDKRLES